MSYDLNKLVKLSALQQLTEKIKNAFETKEEINNKLFIINFRRHLNNISLMDSTYDEICEKLNDDKIIVVARIADTRGAETLISSQIILTSNKIQIIYMSNLIGNKFYYYIITINSDNTVELSEMQNDVEER